MPNQRTSTGLPPVPRSPVSDTPVKIGKPYQVAGIWYYPADEASYDEVGYASWYGDAFHGGPTANGEVYDMNMVGAAHKTLPLPSYAEVTALDTGRTVLVRINDRGPFVTNRIIDLSRRAAEQLGIARQGVARVRVRRVYPGEADRLALRSGRAASERPVQSSTALAALDTRFQRWLIQQTRPVVTVAQPVQVQPPPLFSAASIGGYFVQIGAYGDRSRADSLASQLGGSIDAAGNVYRVRIGPYFDEEMALAALARAQGQGYQDARLIRPTATN
jgi:rare lipoprotein A